MGKKGKRGGGGGGAKQPQAGAPEGSGTQPQQQQQQRQQPPPTPQEAPHDFPPPGSGGGSRGGKQKQQGGRGDGPGSSSAPQPQEGGRGRGRGLGPGPSSAPQPQERGRGRGRGRGLGPSSTLQAQQPPEYFPPLETGDGKKRQKGKQQSLQEEQGPRTPQQYEQQPTSQQYYPPHQQVQQPPPQQVWQQQQQQGMQPAWRGPPRGGAPGFVSGQRPPEPSFFAPPPVQQGPPRFGGRGQQPPQFQQRPSTPQYQSRESTPTHQPRASSESSSSSTSEPYKRQTSVSDQQSTKQQPAAQPPSRQQPAAQPPSRQQPQRKSPPGAFSMIPKRLDRPSDQKKGRQIIVETNHLALDIKNKNMIVCHYDVSVNPEKPFRIYRKALEEVRKKCYPKRYPAFDGKKNLYSYPELPINTSELVETVTIYDDERDQTKEVTVTIKFANHVDLSTILDYLRNGCSINSPQDAIQAIDIVLRQPAANRFVTVGRSFFTPPPGQVICLGDGLDLWYGFFQSAIIGWKPYLNIDVAHKGFPTPESCVEALRKIISSSSRDGDVRVEDQRFQMKHYQEDAFLTYIKNLKVVYEIPQRSIKRTYKVTGMTTCARDNRFEVVDKEKKTSYQTTVEKYFQTQYKYSLKCPHLPCLTVGSHDKPLSLPMELCRIAEGQVTMKKMNDIQTRNMVKQAAVDTQRRKQKIMQSIQQINFNMDPCIREFGLSVADRFTRVPARILAAPTVDYRENRTVSVAQGVWRNQKFLKGAELVDWRILNTNRYIREQELRALGDGLAQHGQSCGMNISNKYQYVTKENASDIEKYFRLCQQEQIKLVIVILPDRGVTYASVKKLAELQVGILTQCLKTATVKNRLSPPTFVNILQKVNAKLNGINHQITHAIWPEFFKKPVIVVGADVTHPAPDQINVPSIAAVAASHDARAFQYNMIWKLQPPREEVIKDLQAIMKEQLLMFYKATNYKPHAILFYRDGVSEGQFKTILSIELMAIRQACSSLSEDYKPPITFLVVQKRHHTRFFPERKDADGRNMNVPAGTVVDTEITHPTELDFYLVSHASIQGTARPTKYHLLWDDSNMSEQTLEEITYYLCHLFTRCTRSVSYPAPTYYAHLAAFRARSYTETERLQLDQLDKEQDKRTVKIITKSNPMYFV